MKLLMITSALLFGLAIGRSFAQGTAPEALKQEMKKLESLVGRWKGEATTKRANAPSTKILQEENIQFKLDTTILLIEGTGRSTEAGNAIMFNALAIVSYDVTKKEFKFKSYVMDGNQTDAYFKIVSENHFEWGFDIANNAKIRYDMVLNPQEKSWIEKGEYSPDGNVWYPYIELKLKKLD
jgi:hypothetical protein